MDERCAGVLGWKEGGWEDKRIRGRYIVEFGVVGLGWWIQMQCAGEKVEKVGVMCIDMGLSCIGYVNYSCGKEGMRLYWYSLNSQSYRIRYCI